MLDFIFYSISYRIVCWITWRNYAIITIKIVPTWINVWIWRRYGSSKADGGNHLALDSLRQWERERERFSSFDHPKDTSLSLLYPLALRTIPIGYWASRALGPSSKARDDIGLYTLGDPYSRLNQKLHVKI